jgi:hypothetical protein
MADLIARQRIPDSWAENARCMLCGYSPMTVERKDQSPDQLKCPQCGLGIVLDESGEYACISCLPNALQGAVTAKWMKVPELIGYLKVAYKSKLRPQPSPFKDFDSENIDTIPNQDSPPIPTSQEGDESLPDPAKITEELAFKTKALYDLGNPSWKIHQILIDTSKYTEEQIKNAMQDIQSEEKKKSNKSTKKIVAILLVALVIFGILVGIFKFVTSFYAPKIDQANQYIKSASTQVSIVRTENPPVVPVEIQTIAPPGTNIINVPTPYVVNLPGGGSADTKRTTCPTTSAAAAALFGGNEKSWNQQQGQWVLLDNNGATINLPKGMSAGYLVVTSSMEMKSVLGPARIGNIYMITISCN